MSPAEFLEYKAWFRLEPWGETAAWLRAGAICAAMFNSRGNGHVADAEDFIPDLISED